LDIGNSKVIIFNHIFDAIAKYHIYNKTGIFIDDLLYNKQSVRISKEGKAFFDSVNSRNRVKALGALDVNEILEDKGDGYYLRKFSELGKNTIDKTDQPTHRLLNLILSDSCFTVESLKRCILSSQPFERIYCIGLSDEDLGDFRDRSRSTSRNNYIEEFSATINLVSK
jgi:hypothetical protein